MTLMLSAFLRMAKSLKSVKGLALLVVLVAYVIMVDTNLQQRQLLLADHYEMARDLITKDLGGGICDIGSPTQDAEPASSDATKTLLASYPGSGKRFTWTIIKALTNSEVADDWNFSGKLNESPLTIKTSFPHKEGRWSWGKQMDQVILLVRNPRWAIPSYHNMRFELDYATDWASSYVNIPSTYTERPAVTQWESWRDSHFNSEVTKWANFIDFWMEGGFEQATNKTHNRCIYSEIDCHPKAVVDFDHFYQGNPNAEFTKIIDVLDTSANVGVIAAQARVCVLESVFEKKELHQGGRPTSVVPLSYRFTMTEFDMMLNKTMELVDKYSEVPWDQDNAAQDLVGTLTNYIKDLKGEHSLEVAIYLEDFMNSYLNCNDAMNAEVDVCTYMAARSNHNFFDDDYFPFNFPYWQWLKDRTILAKFYFYMYYYAPNFQSPGQAWVTGEDHCTWEGVTCVEHRVTELNLASLDLTGNFPTGLDKLAKLEKLDVRDNSLVGTVPDELCTLASRNVLQIYGDAANCPNTYNSNSGQWSNGCCAEVNGLP